jgi:S1-C subfamily serine protease
MMRLGNVTRQLTVVAAAVATAVLLAPNRPAVAEQQVECSLPTGKVVNTGRTDCRDQLGLVLRVLPGSSAPSGQVSRQNADDYLLWGVGSGFFVTGGGTVLTSAHVVDQCDELLVESPGVEVAPASVRAREDSIDLAVIETRLRPSAVAQIRSAPDAAVGDAVLIVGFPGESMADWPHVGPGVVTRLAAGGEKLVALSFAGHAEGGMSGGPLLDEHGRVAGVVFAASQPASSRSEAWREHGSAIEAPVVRDFLGRNGVRYTSAAAPVVRSVGAVTELARAMTVRVLCLVKE